MGISQSQPDAIHIACIVCTTNRSGSTLFCEALAGAGCGDPNEYFEETLAAIWREKWGLPANADETAYMREVLVRGTHDGIFAAKLMHHQVPRALHLLGHLCEPQSSAPDLATMLARVFRDVRYFWVRREDAVAQAISLVRARQSGRWHSVDTSGWVGVAPERNEEVFDFAEIDRIVFEQTYSDRQWGKFFKAHGIEPMTLIYEDFTARYDEALRAALAFAGRPIAEMAPVPPPRHRKIGDSVNVEWAERYRALKQAGAGCQPPPSGRRRH